MLLDPREFPKTSSARSQTSAVNKTIPWFGVRAFARNLIGELEKAQSQRDSAVRVLDQLGALSLLEIETLKAKVGREFEEQFRLLAQKKAEAEAALAAVNGELQDARRAIVETKDVALLQEAGIYHYRHPLTDAVAFEKELATLQNQIKEMNRKDGGAIEAAQNWTVNGSAAEGRKMVRDFSKLMLRAFNAEADNLVRGLKPYKLGAALQRLDKVAETIERLGRTMNIRVAPGYLRVRQQELELTADFLQKQAELRELERQERDRLRDERKAQQEIERERARLEKERQHYTNALNALIAKGDEAALERLRTQVEDVDRALADVDYRAANIRAGYVYVVSNIGSFGERMIKVGMTRRLDPVERIRELSDASVPFNFDVHALFFSKDAVAIENAMHDRLAGVRVNVVNARREFFHATPAQAKAHLAELTGELLEFEEIPEALEYRQGLKVSAAAA
jgi:hypothetical protein